MFVEAWRADGGYRTDNAEPRMSGFQKEFIGATTGGATGEEAEFA